MRKSWSSRRRMAPHTEYVVTTITVSLMHGPAVRTTPYSYPEVTQSTRSCECITGRASDRRAIFRGFAVEHTQPFGLVFQACANEAPARIVHGLGHEGFGKLGTGNVAHRDQRCTGDNLRGDFMGPVFATVGNLGMNGFDALLLSRPLG